MCVYVRTCGRAALKVMPPTVIMLALAGQRQTLVVRQWRWNLVTSILLHFVSVSKQRGTVRRWVLRFNSGDRNVKEKPYSGQK